MVVFCKLLTRCQELGLNARAPKTQDGEELALKRLEPLGHTSTKEMTWHWFQQSQSQASKQACMHAWQYDFITVTCYKNKALIRAADYFKLQQGDGSLLQITHKMPGARAQRKGPQDPGRRGACTKKTGASWPHFNKRNDMALISTITITSKQASMHACMTIWLHNCDLLQE